MGSIRMNFRYIISIETDDCHRMIARLIIQKTVERAGEVSDSTNKNIFAFTH